jgi:dTDP-4-amino-4,6-dideoxygalactose transaminase
MSDINAFIGLTQLKHVPEYVKNRNTLASLYAEKLSGISWLRPQKLREGNFSSYYVYIVKVEKNSQISRDELMARLKEIGIGTSILYNPVHLQPLYVKLFGFERGMLPIAEDLGERTVALPMYSDMTPDDVDYVINAIKQVSKEA